ncbi:MAG: TIGR00282 family metallophosphoesterase [Sphaerochaetaceae bacterium]|nr:TIGR00282 family metallophosphoesterase [Sphaerochaetaceae bacterium]
MPADTIRTLLLGDVYGDSGCRVIFYKLASVVKKYKADRVVLNIENAYNGFGLSVENLNMFLGLGIDAMTSGNHIWQQNEILPYLDSEPKLLRPANYGNSVQGHGYVLVNGIGVVNVQGRLNMPATEDPFRWASECVRKLKAETKTVFVDIHAESAEEKEALGVFLDGEVTAVVGTHTHVQTADERILEKGTAYISDLGFCGPSDSIIGCDEETAFKRQLTQMPIRARSAEGEAVICGVCVVSDIHSGKALSIERFVSR